MTARTSGPPDAPRRGGSDGFTAAVLAWGGPRLRDLPWRRTRDPWAVLVSEVMLQQTQAQRVVPAWHRFLEAFPTPEACAAGSLGEVLRVWQGLGYPRRARNLQDAACAITAAGTFPSTLPALLALPGVGPYTARAVLVFAFEMDAAVVDTNIARVLARVAGHRLTARQVQQAADDSVPSGDSWLWNQVLMDLGAAVCRPEPHCTECPLASWCEWHGSGHRDPDPAVGSAGVSGRQAPFAGSDRQARGNLLRALGMAPVASADVADVMGRSTECTERLLAALVDERLVVTDGSTVRLPGGRPGQVIRPADGEGGI